MANKYITLSNLSTFKTNLDARMQAKLSTSNVNQGTLSQLLGFDSSGNLVRNTSPISTMQIPAAGSSFTNEQLTILSNNGYFIEVDGNGKYQDFWIKTETDSDYMYFSTNPMKYIEAETNERYLTSANILQITRSNGNFISYYEDSHVDTIKTIVLTQQQVTSVDPLIVELTDDQFTIINELPYFSINASALEFDTDLDIYLQWSENIEEDGDVVAHKDHYYSIIPQFGSTDAFDIYHIIFTTPSNGDPTLELENKMITIGSGGGIAYGVAYEEVN